ncbi:MAG: hypothetical protein IH936_16330 [Acidobacteria bacterium]|nr:hypothetical protein [Acidobacteriota bacterium]
MKRVPPTHAVAAFLLASAFSLGLATARADLDLGGAVITYDHSPETLLVSFRELIGELAEQDPIPLIQIFGDGRVLVHYPDYLQHAGDYELRLGRGELEALLQSLVAKGLATFDSKAVRSEKQAEMSRRRNEALEGLATGERPTFFFVADDSVSVFELNLEGYRPPGSPGLTQSQLRRRISWLGLATDAERFEEIEAIQQLYAAELELRGLLERDGLIRLEGQNP